jgi:hypothetical protein
LRANAVLGRARTLLLEEGRAYHCTVVVTMEDIDRLLESASAVGADAPPERIRARRDELAHVAVLLAYARHVLSVDIGVLQQAVEVPGTNFTSVVASLPETLAAASVGGGWSLSPDAPSTMNSANQLVDGEADGLLTVHARLAGADISSPDKAASLLDELEVQLLSVTRRWEDAEAALQRLQSQLATKYKTGEASVDDWLR